MARGDVWEAGRTARAQATRAVVRLIDVQGDFEEPRAIVGVTPGAGGTLDAGVQGTLDALTRVLPVSFVAAGAGQLDGLDALLTIGDEAREHTPPRLPQLLVATGAPAGHGSPDPRATDESIAGDRATGAPVALAASEWLPAPLRGRSIPEAATAHAAGTPPAPHAEVLARRAGRPVWWRTTADDGSALAVSAFPLAALDEGEALRDRLRAGSFMGLLPLLELIAGTLGERGWALPPLRAAFVIDDPNLHRPAYGFVDYAQLAAHARLHGYHVAMATVPIDGWHVNRRARTLFAANADVLSLIVHGNDHVARELGRLSDDAHARTAMAQALRRVQAIERRSGLAVDRVVAPPHGACSEPALRAMFQLGMEAACISRPYPWRDGQPAPSVTAGWRPAELVAGGLPVLPRHPLSGAREDLALRALLGQPLILYGHHGDLAGGLDVLAQAAADVSALGGAHWGPLREIARGSYSTRRSGELLEVRLHARHVEVEVPEGVRRLRVHVDEPFGGAAGHAIAHPGGTAALAFDGDVGRSVVIELDGHVAGRARVRLTLAADSPLRPQDVPAPARSMWPLVRRALVETRDRLAPLRERRAGREAVGGSR